MDIGSHWLKDNGYWQSLVKKQWVLAANDCQYTGQDKLALQDRLDRVDIKGCQERLELELMLELELELELG